MNKNPKVSIILPFRNEIEDLDKCLSSFVNSGYKNMEIIIIDDESTDGSSEIAKKYAKEHKFITYLWKKHLPNTWATHAYLLGIEKAKGDLIYIADANVMVEKDYFEKSIKYLLDSPEVAGVVGKVRLWPPKTFISKHKSVVYDVKFADLKRINREISEGKILPRLVTRAAYEKIGGIDPNVRWSLDTDFTKRLLKAGYKIAYAPDAVWFHKWRDSVSDLVKYSLKFGKYNHKQAGADFKQTVKILFFILPLVFIILSFLDRIFLFFLAVHFSIVFFSGLVLFKKSKNMPFRNYALLTPLISYIQNIPYSLGFILGYFEGEKLS